MAKATRGPRIHLPTDYKHKKIDTFCRNLASQSNTTQASSPTRDLDDCQPLADDIPLEECEHDNQVTMAEQQLIDSTKLSPWLKAAVEKLWKLSIRNIYLKQLYREYKLGRLFFELKKQWVFNLDIESVDPVVESCKLCGHKHVSKHFHIQHKKNGTIIKAGSECVKKFRVDDLSKEDSLMVIKHLIGSLP
ncbi:predicted protein [Naegleria gruberi]|uniref:Predicted protein n=1 Tax=Naegleria gruberi TaxID=5762 RepID=D2VF96_NAEGR|nr:uncharacterized protein NAEGRDRAFT_67547 [Naegleria gruberi]EFC44331.1 predicted protein [Naegleria gruberi]|eukprot:XP_002677075.1 predicted protein [Naegleria gruberi strain NEG-M]